jgi:hypothetical protein
MRSGICDMTCDGPNITGICFFKFKFFFLVKSEVGPEWTKLDMCEPNGNRVDIMGPDQTTMDNLMKSDCYNVIF